MRETETGEMRMTIEEGRMYQERDRWMGPGGKDIESQRRIRNITLCPLSAKI